MMDQSTSRRVCTLSWEGFSLVLFTYYARAIIGTRVTAIVTVELVGGTGLGISETSMIII